MKHLIFTGKPKTGKSLFAKMIFGTEKAMWINGRENLLNTPFLFDSRGAWNFDTIIIDDLRSDFNIDSFYTTICAPLLKIDRQGRESITVTMPRFVFILENQDLLPIDSPSFIRRFKLIDFDKNPIKDLMKIIKEEKIIVEAARF